MQLLFATVFSIGLILAFAASVRFVIVPPDEDGWLHIDMEALTEKRGRVVALLVYAMIALGGCMLVLTLPMVTGEIARGELSPSLWDQFISEQRKGDFLSGILSALALLIFYLWAFLIPGHIYATIVTKDKGRRPWHPYVINILVGLLLSTPHNPIYYLLGGGSGGGEY
jgi:hypothetical protein